MAVVCRLAFLKDSLDLVDEFGCKFFLLVFFLNFSQWYSSVATSSFCKHKSQFNDCYSPWRISVSSYPAPQILHNLKDRAKSVLKYIYMIKNLSYFITTLLHKDRELLNMKDVECYRLTKENINLNIDFHVSFVFY